MIGRAKLILDIVHRSFMVILITFYRKLDTIEVSWLQFT